MFDGKAFGAEVVGIVKDHVARELAPLRAENAELMRRLAAVEARQPERGEKGEPGEAGQVGVGVAGAVIDRSGVLILTLSDGRTHELGAVVGKDGVNGLDGKDGEPGADGRDGADGASVDMEAMAEQIRQMVADEVAALPPPAKGEKGDTGECGEPGPAGERGADGIGVMGAAIDRNGELLLTLSDGSVRELGQVLGQDGQPGAAGRDGKDGLGFDDLSVEYDGERSFSIKFEKDGRAKEFSFAIPAMIDRGVYKEGQTYSAGDTVTWAGSIWTAQKETAAKPDSGDGWRLSVKRGRDGKDKV